MWCKITNKHVKYKLVHSGITGRAQDKELQNRIKHNKIWVKSSSRALQFYAINVKV